MIDSSTFVDPRRAMRRARTVAYTNRHLLAKFRAGERDDARCINSYGSACQFCGLAVLVWRDLEADQAGWLIGGRPLEVRCQATL